MEVKAGEAFDNGFDPTDVENRGAAIFLPAAEAIVELEKAHEALGVVEEIL